MSEAGKAGAVGPVAPGAVSPGGGRRVALAVAAAVASGAAATAALDYVSLYEGEPTWAGLSLEAISLIAGAFVATRLLGATVRVAVAAACSAALAALPVLAASVGQGRYFFDVLLVFSTILAGALPAATTALLSGTPGARPPLLDRAAHAARAVGSYLVALVFAKLLLLLARESEIGRSGSWGEASGAWGLLVGGLVLGLPLARGLVVASAPPPRMASATERAKRALAPLWARVLLALGVGEALRRPLWAVLEAAWVAFRQVAGGWAAQGTPAPELLRLAAALLATTLAVALAAAAIADLDRPRPRLRAVVRVGFAAAGGALLALLLDLAAARLLDSGQWISLGEGVIFLLALPTFVPAAGGIARARLYAEEQGAGPAGARALAIAGASAMIVAWVIVAALVFVSAAFPWMDLVDAGDFVRIAPAALVLSWAFAEASMRRAAEAKAAPAVAGGSS